MEKTLLTSHVVASVKMSSLLLAAGALLSLATLGHAAIVITEVDPSGSSSTSNTYNQDWFELTNTGSSAQDITGWAMDDSSHTFSLAVSLRGVTSIAPGQSVVFVEDGTDATKDAALDAAFESFWFGSNVPAGFTIGNYGGSGVGLSQTADEVNIYNSTGTEITGVGFGVSATGVSFDNAAGIGSNSQPDPLISTASVAGTNGAFNSPNVGTLGVAEIGSPGTIANATPEPASLTLLTLGTLTLLSRRRK